MSRIKVRHVEFSPEELAYDAPSEIDFSKGPTFRGIAEWRRFLSFKRGYVRLDPDVAKYYRDSQTVNDVLRKLMEVDEVIRAPKRKTA